MYIGVYRMMLLFLLLLWFVYLLGGLSGNLDSMGQLRHSS